MRKEWIERYVVSLTQDTVLKRDDVIDKLSDAVVELQKRENTTIPFLQKQLDEINKRIGNLLNAIEEGMMNVSAKQRLDELEVKKADLEIALAREKIEKTSLTKEQIVFWISRFKDGDIGDPVYCKSIVDIFVNSIFLYDDKLVIAFNWKDGTKTVTLSELEAAANEDTPTEKTDDSLCTAQNECSHLDCCTPPAKKSVPIRVSGFFLFWGIPHIYLFCRSSALFLGQNSAEKRALIGCNLCNFNNSPICCRGLGYPAMISPSPSPTRRIFSRNNPGARRRLPLC